MATLDKHADDQNWNTVGGKKRLPDSGAQMHGVAHVDTSDVANRYDKADPRSAQEVIEGQVPQAPPRYRGPGNDAGLGAEPRPASAPQRAPLTDL